jgi:hypothetical protein
MTRIGIVTYEDFAKRFEETKKSFPLVDTVIGMPIMPTSNTNGKVKPVWGTTEDCKIFSDAVHASGKKAMTYVYGSVGGEGKNGEVNLTTIIKNGQLNTLVSSIEGYLTINNLDGVEIDFESPGDPDQASMNTLIDTLYKALSGRILSISVMAGKWISDFTITESRLNELNHLDVMTYDQFWFSPGNSDGYKHALQANMIYAMNKWSGVSQSNSPLWKPAVPVKKLNVGIPFYGYDTSKVSYHYRDVAGVLVGNDCVVNGKNVWCPGPTEIKMRADWAKANGYGTFIFSLGYDKDQVLVKSTIESVQPEPVKNVMVKLDGVVIGEAKAGETVSITTTVPTITPAVLNYTPPQINISGD